MGIDSLGSNTGRLLVIAGLLTVIVGLLLMFGPRIPWLGRLPGDIIIKRENFTFYFPLATCVLISLLLSLLVKFFRR